MNECMFMHFRNNTNITHISCIKTNQAAKYIHTALYICVKMSIHAISDTLYTTSMLSYMLVPAIWNALLHTTETFQKLLYKHFFDVVCNEFKQFVHFHKQKLNIQPMHHTSQAAQ